MLPLFAPDCDPSLRDATPAARWTSELRAEIAELFAPLAVPVVKGLMQFVRNGEGATGGEYVNQGRAWHATNDFGAEVLRLSGEGVSCREIGRRLQLSRPTVERILKRHGVRLKRGRKGGARS